MSKNVLITGASKGIGQAIAIELSQRGYTIGINYCRSAEGAEKTAEICRSYGAQTAIFKADVGNTQDIENMFDAYERAFGTIDLMVNNAGVSMFTPFLQMTEQMWDTVTAIDWKGTYFCAQKAAQLMIRTGRSGVILNMSSNQKDGCWPTASVYGPTKAAIAKFTRHIAMELAPHGIRAVAIAPGYTDVGWPEDDPIHEAKEKIPLKRFAQPQEIAKVIAAMVSEDFAYMTGACLDIDGGALLPIHTENDLDTVWSST